MADSVGVSAVYWVVAAVSQADRDLELFDKEAVFPAHRTCDPLQKGGHGIGDPAHGCGGKIRPAVECSGYTYSYLPVRKESPPWFMKVDAIRAILAARMAFSSFRIRS